MKERILALVAEKDRLPGRHAGPGLDLEADLGVDTVKQAELFAAVREIYNISARRKPQAARLSNSGACHPVRV